MFFSTYRIIVIWAPMTYSLNSPSTSFGKTAHLFFIWKPQSIMSISSKSSTICFPYYHL
uniref:Uncharacterized protein n=1 Tax=Helianthus annuus TaxID=4232 RepID=A0A251SBP0_HELAN